MTTQPKAFLNVSRAVSVAVCDVLSISAAEIDCEKVSVHFPLNGQENASKHSKHN